MSKLNFWIYFTSMEGRLDNASHFVTPIFHLVSSSIPTLLIYMCPFGPSMPPLVSHYMLPFDLLLYMPIGLTSFPVPASMSRNWSTIVLTSLAAFALLTEVRNGRENLIKFSNSRKKENNPGSLYLNNSLSSGCIISSVNSPFSERFGLPLHNIPSLSMKNIGAEFLRPNVLPGVNHIRGMQYQKMILNITIYPELN